MDYIHNSGLKLLNFDGFSPIWPLYLAIMPVLIDGMKMFVNIYIISFYSIDLIMTTG